MDELLTEKEEEAGVLDREKPYTKGQAWEDLQGVDDSSGFRRSEPLMVRESTIGS